METDNEEARDISHTAISLINPMIPPLRKSDSVNRALGWMEEFRITQLPIVENKKYLGIISEDTLIDLGNPDMEISEIEPEFADVFISENKHFYDVFKIADENDLQVLAVVGEKDKEFKGAIAIRDTIDIFAKTYASHVAGGVLILSMGYYDYSLSQISRLIEENEAKIVSSFIETDPQDPTKIKLTLKINKEDLTRIIATLERFNYRIIAAYHVEPDTDWGQDRINLLMKYLNM
jgi:CBS domain-containing protein